MSQNKLHQHKILTYIFLGLIYTRIQPICLTGEVSADLKEVVDSEEASESPELSFEILPWKSLYCVDSVKLLDL